MMIYWKQPVSLLILTLLAVGCASKPTPVATESAEPDEVGLASEITRTDEKIEEEPKGEEVTTTVSEHPRLLTEINADVQKWIDYFTVDNRDAFDRFLKRGAVYRTMVEKTLGEYGVPKEFYYLAMIESGYSTRAVSSAQAVGIWQFIRGTGQRYGLRYGRGIDERRDPVRSTRAAAQYLKDLYNVFGSWRLAMSAYNAGERRILTAIMRGKTRDFWTLAEKRVLPAETMDYVPKFLAAAIIGENPEKYGFDVTEFPAWEAVPVEIPSPIRLATVAKETGIPLAELKRLNPHLLADATPSDSAKYAVSFPKETVSIVKSLASSLVPSRLPTPVRLASNKSRRETARAGEVMPAGFDRLKRRLESRRLSAPQKLKPSKQSSSEILVYRVKRGDTLFRIANHFGVTMRQIKKLNRLRGSSVQFGQALKIRRSGSINPL